MFLILNVFPDYIRRDFITYTPDKVSVPPYPPRPHGLTYFRELLEYLPSRYTLHNLHHLCRSVTRRSLDKHMHVVFHHFHRVYMKFVFLRYLFEYAFYISPYFFIQYMHPKFRHPYKMVFQFVDRVLCSPYSHIAFIPSVKVLTQTSLLRLAVNRFPPLSKLRGIQRSFL